MPADTYSAIYAYNHADWYVAEVLANAACYAGIGGAVGGAFSLTPQLQVLSCRPAEDWREAVPDEYMAAFESAAARYELGRSAASGRWPRSPASSRTSAAGWARGRCRSTGRSGSTAPSGRPTRSTATKTARVRHADPDDSAATLARLIWSRGGLRAGIFTHNQAQWYVQAVLAEAEQLEGRLQADARSTGRVALPERRRPRRSTGTT